MQIVLATSNRDKIKEMKHLLDDLPITILSRDDFLEWPEVDENGSSLLENAIIKAKAIAEFTSLPALADDSGLEVDALGGAPGIFSARYAGENCSYHDNNVKMLRELSALPDEKRTARFRCVIAVCWEDGRIESVDGLAEGLISHEIDGNEGFGYDPIFFYPPENKRFSQMTIDEKNLVSHRGKALQEVRTLIIQRVNQRRSG